MSKKRKCEFVSVGCFGVIQPNGKLWMSESCIVEDRETAENEILPQPSEEVVGKCEVVELFALKRGQR